MLDGCVLFFASAVCHAAGSMPTPPSISAPHPTPLWRWLVLGCGNDLRGDDAAGRILAEKVARAGIPGVQARSLHQWGPELAEDLAGVERGLLIDAFPAAPGDTPRLTPLRPAPDNSSSPAPGPLRHVTAPADLLVLCRSIYGYAPELWILAIPAFDMTLGEGLSPETTALIPVALQQILELVQPPTGTAEIHSGA